MTRKTHQIITINGIYEYVPVKLYNGRKFLDSDTSKKNLLDFRKFALNNQLPFGIIYGTLLGAVRKNSFIEYDEDTDVYILDEYREHLLSLLFRLREIGFEVARYDQDLLSVMRDNDYIDIYIFRKTIFNRRVCNEDSIPGKYFDSFSTINFLGTEFNTLYNYLSFLEKAYGKDWMIPKRNSPAEVKNLNIRLKRYLRKMIPDLILSMLEKRM